MPPQLDHGAQLTALIKSPTDGFGLIDSEH
jgi:hypothetical protein